MGITLRQVAYLFLFTALLTGFSHEAAAQVYLTDDQPVSIRFDNFRGEGLSSSPAAGQLDSDTWSFTGLSDGSLSFGSERAADAFAMGISRGGVTSGGLYAFEVSSNNPALGIQASESDFTPGTITLKIINDTGRDLTDISFGFDLFELNNGDRESSISFSYAMNPGEEGQVVPGMEVRTAGESDQNPHWNVRNRSTVLPVNLPAGAALYLKWSLDDISGFGEGRDEIALDNITIEALGGESDGFIRSGDLAVTEIMVSTGGAGTGEFEYIELYNRTNRPVNLAGFILEDGSGNIHRISPAEAETVVAPYGFYVLAGIGREAGNDGFKPDYIYGSNLDFGGTGTRMVRIRNGDLTVAEASFNPSGEGRAVELDRVESAHDGITVPDDYNGVTIEETFGNGRLGSPGKKGINQELTYGIRLDERNGWNLLSLPLQRVEAARLADDLRQPGDLTGDFNETSLLYSGYDGSRFTEMSDRFEPIASGSGVMTYLDGRPESEGGASMIDLAGSVPESDVTVPLHSDGDRWNLVGNPYTAPIDVRELESQNGALASRVGQFWDDSLSSFVLTTTRNHTVPPWNGFFIQNNNARNLSIPESAYRGSGRDEFIDSRGLGNERMISFELTGYDQSTDRRTTDLATALVFSEDAGHGWDNRDAGKLMPLPEHSDRPYYGALLYFDGTRNGVKVAKAQESRPYEPRGRTVLNLGVKSIGIRGDFVLRWNRVNIPEQWSVTLIDRRNGEEIDLGHRSVYRFSSSKTAEIDMMGSDFFERNISADNIPDEHRFRLVVEKRTLGRTGRDREQESVTLNPNYPNPFNPSTTVSFELSRSEKVTLTVHTVIGQKVATLVDETLEAGTHRETWNASDMPSGIYILQLVVGGREYTRKMTLIK